jgi:hypothetical protein
MSDSSIIHDWPGWLLIILSFICLVFIRETRKSGKLAFTFFFLLTLHHMVALTNSYITTTYGAAEDAAQFHINASDIANNDYSFSFAIDSTFYDQFLGLSYKMFGTSHLFGQELSILAFLFSCFIFVKICNMFYPPKLNVPLLCLFGALPTMVLMGSVTLRESWQILFFMLSVYFGFLFHLFGKKHNLILCGLFAFIMGLFHNGLIIYALFLVGIMMYWQVRAKKFRGWLRFSRHRFFAICIGGVVVSVVVIGLRSASEVEGLSAFSALSKGDALEYIKKYRSNTIEVGSRATYGITFDTSSWSTMATTFIPAWFMYMLAPFPWQVTNMIDLYAAMESLLRLTLVIFALLSWRKATGVQRRCFSLLLILYFSMSLLWALGTTNYGTGIRHQMINYWIVVILGAPGLIRFIQRQLLPVPFSSSA